MSPSLWFRLLGLSALLSTVGFTFPAWTQGKAKGKKYALVVGVTEYDSKNFKPLRFTVSSAGTQALTKAGRAPLPPLTCETRPLPSSGNIAICSR